MTEWTKVEDGLPEETGEVLACTRRKNIFIAGVNASSSAKGWKIYFANTHIDCGYCDEITHWMPLPAPPKDK